MSAFKMWRTQPSQSSTATGASDTPQQGLQVLITNTVAMAAARSKAEAFTSLNVRDEVHYPQHQDQCADHGLSDPRGKVLDGVRVHEN